MLKKRKKYGTSHVIVFTKEEMEIRKWSEKTILDLSDIVEVKEEKEKDE